VKGDSRAHAGRVSMESFGATFGQAPSYTVFGRPAFLFQVTLVLNRHVEFYESFVVMQEELTDKGLVVLVRGGISIM